MTGGSVHRLLGHRRYKKIADKSALCDVIVIFMPSLIDPLVDFFAHTPDRLLPLATHALPACAEQVGIQSTKEPYCRPPPDNVSRVRKIRQTSLATVGVPLKESFNAIGHRGTHLRLLRGPLAKLLGCVSLISEAQSCDVRVPIIRICAFTQDFEFVDHVKCVSGSDIELKIL
jgi:hypothetical protein